MQKSRMNFLLLDILSGLFEVFVKNIMLSCILVRISLHVTSKIWKKGFEEVTKSTPTFGLFYWIFFLPFLEIFYCGREIRTFCLWRYSLELNTTSFVFLSWLADKRYYRIFLCSKIRSPYSKTIIRLLHIQFDFSSIPQFTFLFFFSFFIYL